MKVLIVEDDPIALEYLVDGVESQGHTVAVAEDGVMGLKTFREFAPDLVLADVRMPRIDGLLLLELIRKDDPDLLVVLMTANGTHKDARSAAALGADAYLHKPLRIRDLFALLEKCAKLVDKRRTWQQSDPSRCQALSAVGTI